MEKKNFENLDSQILDKIILKNKDKPGSLLTILEKVQGKNKFKYLTKDMIEYIATKTGYSNAHIYSVVTFYSFFNLKPQGKHSITICRGTACHARGSKWIYKDVLLLLGVKKGDDEDQDEHSSITTEDKKFTIKTVACFGQCALAPVVSIDENIYGYLTKKKLKKIIGQIGNKKNEDK